MECRVQGRVSFSAGSRLGDSVGIYSESPDLGPFASPEYDDVKRFGNLSAYPRCDGTLRAIRLLAYQPGEFEMEICAHMEVVDANDQHVGTVESIEGDRIKMFEKDALDPKELFLNRSQVAEVDINKVRLSQKESAITTRAFLSPEYAEKITKKG